MFTDTEELIGFLGDRRPEVKKMAVDIVEGLTGSPEGIDKLKTVHAQLLPALFRLLSDPDPATSRGALVALVNLSHDTAVSEKLLSMNVVGRVMDYTKEKSCPHVDLLLMLLSNITGTDQGCKDLLQLDKPGMEGLYMAILLKLFMTSSVTLNPGDPDPFEHIAAIITNLTRLQQGRSLLLQPGRGLLQALASQLQSPSVLRRRGSSGAVRNCCLSSEADGTLAQLVSDELVLVKLLRPLSGEAPLEADDGVREALAEAVALLASTQVGRDALYKIDASELLRKGYEREESPGVCKAMEQAARYLLFNSGDVTTED